MTLSPSVHEAVISRHFVNDTEDPISAILTRRRKSNSRTRNKGC